MRKEDVYSKTINTDHMSELFELAYSLELQVFLGEDEIENFQ